MNILLVSLPLKISVVMCDSFPWEGGGRGLFGSDIAETPPCHRTDSRTPPVGREF